MPIKLENVGIAVRDLEATIAFFTDLGLTVLGRDIIHSVTNPLDKVSYAIHVYDGDFLSAEGKSCWHAETLYEMPYDAGKVSPAFGQALTSR